MTKQQDNDHTPLINRSALSQDDLPQPLSLLLFTQRLAALMEAHIALPRALTILRESPAPYGTVAERLLEQIEKGNALCEAMSMRERELHPADWWHPRSLAKAMSQHPDHFSAAYVAVIDAAEISGTVDETLRRVQNALGREWRLLAARPEDETLMFWSRTVDGSRAEDWRQLSAYQQMAMLTAFFETFSMMLTSGVALLPAMDTVCALLPKKQQGEFLQIRTEIRDGAPLLPLPIERLDFIPRYAKEVVGLGMMKGCAETALHDVALVFEQELEYRLQGAYSLAR